MVTIVDYLERKREDGTSFFVLELQGGVELVQSKDTGGFYATAKKTTIPATFDEETCLSLVGTEIQGKIVKEECEPFEYVIKETGEEIILNHRWTFVPEDNDSDPTENADSSNDKLQFEEFSQNGALEVS